MTYETDQSLSVSSPSDYRSNTPIFSVRVTRFDIRSWGIRHCRVRHTIHTDFKSNRPVTLRRRKAGVTRGICEARQCAIVRATERCRDSRTLNWFACLVHDQYVCPRSLVGATTLNTWRNSCNMRLCAFVTTAVNR